MSAGNIASFVIPPWAKFATAGLGILLLGLVIILAFHSYEKHRTEANKALVTQGSLQEQVNEQEQAINAVQNANDVVQHPTVEQLNVVCNKYDRNCPRRP